MSEQYPLAEDTFLSEKHKYIYEYNPSKMQHALTTFTWLSKTTLKVGPLV